MDWISLFSYMLVSAITPGPNNIMSMSNAGRLGLKRALPFNLGIWAGFSAVMLGCTFFCSALSSVIPAVKTPMLIIGAAYMLWLAWKTYKSSTQIEEKSPVNGFISGLTLQFVNPKIYIYCIMCMEAYILPHYQGNYIALALFALMLSTFGFTCTLLWATFGAVFKSLFSKYSKVINIVMALLLVYCAVSLLFS